MCAFDIALQLHALGSILKIDSSRMHRRKQTHEATNECVLDVFLAANESRSLPMDEDTAILIAGIHTHQPCTQLIEYQYFSLHISQLASNI